MDRSILHCDCNSFYASVEALHRPSLRDKPLAVGGDVEQRHGIILAKNDIAKRYQIKTGEALWQARQKCPDLVIVPPNYPLYLRYSKLCREIFMEYTPQVEPFGIDEAWLDVTGSTGIFGGGPQIAEEIRRRIRYELGITVSIGVSFNKIFAKLGSDCKKPDAVTVISRDNYKDVAWPLPASDLLYVGPATRRKLASRYITTIGKLASANPANLRRWFGKWGDVLWAFANGEDRAAVAEFDELSVIKSIGNSCTTPRDLEDDEDVKMVLWVLAESVAARMREQGFVGRTVCISVRDRNLQSFTRQRKLPRPTGLSSEIVSAAMDIFRANYRWDEPIRSIGVSMTDFSHDDIPVQLDMYDDHARRENLMQIEQAVDGLRRRFGNGCVRRATLLRDTALTGFDPKADHIIHPVGYF